jgi:hypothetical protein
MARVTTWLWAAALAAAAVTAAAQPSTALQRRLQSATNLQCTFSVIATGTWNQNRPQVATGDTLLEIAFSDILVDEGTAEAVGELGTSFISVRYAQGYLHLMQISDAGPLYVTTVLAREAGAGRFMAVHTRLEYLPTVVPGFTSRPEMYVGTCAIQNAA